MAINKKLIHFQNKSTFNAQLKAGNLKDTSIVFIKDTQEIWTHGQLYSKNELQEALQNLSNNGIILVVKQFLMFSLYEIIIQYEEYKVFFIPCDTARPGFRLRNGDSCIEQKQ